MREAIGAANDDVAVDGCNAGDGDGDDVIEFSNSVSEVLIDFDNPSDSSNRIIESLSMQGLG